MNTTIKLADIRSWAITYSIGIVFALIAKAINIPLPWMIGPLFATAFLCVTGRQVRAPKYGRNIGQWGIGVALGLYFTPEVVAQLWGTWPYIVASAALAFVLASIGTLILWKGFHIPLHTAYFSSAIGGASEMAVLAEKNGARIDLVAAAHSLRVMMVVVIVPFIYRYFDIHGLDSYKPPSTTFDVPQLMLLIAISTLGIALFKKLKIPNPFMLGPLLIVVILTGTGHQFSSWPFFLSNVCQLLIGVALGSRFSPEFMINAPKLVKGIVVYTLISLVICGVFGWVIGNLSGISIATVVLGTTPGGIAEMCITAKVLYLGVPAVTIFHVIRMCFVVVLTQPIYKYFWAPKVKHAI